MNLIVLFMASLVAAQFAQADLTPVERSVERCQRMDAFYPAKEADKSMLAFTHAGMAGISVMVGVMEASAGVMAAPGSPAAITTIGVGVAAAGAMAGFSVQSTIHLKNSFTGSDFSRLAYELGNDQEGLVTQAFMDSCIEIKQGDCKSTLAALKIEAKNGSMCLD